jgi:DNA-directed RNA polymerase subunit F
MKVSDQLTKSQIRALNYITKYARSQKNEAQLTIKEVLQMSNIDQKAFGEAVDKIKGHARVALHFHPDRPGHNRYVP